MCHKKRDVTNTIGRNSTFFGRIVVIGANVELVSWLKCDSAFEEMFKCNIFNVGKSISYLLLLLYSWLSLFFLP